MSAVVLYSIITLGAISAISAVILFVVARKFKVYEDPRIDEVADLLPGANCGGCGYPGCRGFAEALVKASENGDISALFCSAGGNDTMVAVGKYLGLEVAASEPKIAVVRCGGTKELAPQKVVFDGPSKCAVANTITSGESGCPFGCLGLGDCVAVCDFGAIHIDEKTGLPVVDEDKCVGCGACAKACPRGIIEIKPKGRRDRRVTVLCMNREKGALAMKNCKAACIGCGKCAKACPEKIQAITVTNFLAYIDPKKCIACGKCVSECPTGAIRASFEIIKKDVPKPAPAKADV